MLANLELAPQGDYVIEMLNGVPVLHPVDDEKQSFAPPPNALVKLYMDWKLWSRYGGKPHPTEQERATPLHCVFAAREDKPLALKIIDERCGNLFRHMLIPAQALERGAKYGLPHVRATIGDVNPN